MAAEQRVLAHLNFGNAAELRNAVLGASATRPSTPALGAIFFNSTANRVEYWDGTSWQTLAAEVFTEAAHDSHDHSAIASTIALNEIGQPTGAVSFAGHRITNVATPSDSADAANKSYVDGAVSAEQTARENADAALQSDIDAVAADLATETSARTSADSALDTRVTAVEGQLAALDADFATDAQVTAAVAAETARAEAAEAALAADIVAANAAIDAVEADLATEVARAQAAEAQLQSDLIDATASIEQAGYDLNAEIARATAAEGALDTRLTAAEGDIDTLETDLAAEVARATGAEAGLASDIADVAADLAAETTARENAVSSVEGRVTTIEGTLPSLATSSQVAADLAAEATRADAYADAAAAAAQAAAIAHADLLAQGLNVKEGVRAVVAGTILDANIDPLTQPASGTYTAYSEFMEPARPDTGVELQVGDRVLYITDGNSDIYVVQSGAWVLAEDWDNDPTKQGVFVAVSEGYYGGTAWASYVTEFGHSFTQLTGAGTIWAGDDTIVVDGQTITVNVASVAADLVADHAFARKATATIGDGSATSFTVSHSLGIDVTVSVRDAATGEIVLAAVSCSSGSVTVEFVSAPAADAYRVVIIG